MKTSDLPTNLRLTDLIAKSAGCSRRDSIRVLLMAEVIGRAMGIYFEDMLKRELDAGFLSSDRPTPDNVAACEQRYYSLMEEIKADPELKALYRRVNKLK